MTNDITFIFKKETGSLGLRCLDALQGTTPLAVECDAISIAMSDLFNRLIAKDTSKYKTAILGLGPFSVTFSNGKEPNLKIKSVKGKVEIHLNKLSAQTAALFSTAICAPQTPPVSKGSSTEEKARSSAAPLRQESPQEVPTNEEKPKTKPPLAPVPADVAEPVIVQSASTKPVLLPIPAADIKTSVLREPNEQKKMFNDIFTNMDQQFTKTYIVRRSNQSCKNFGQYLMERIFSKATSHHYNSETGEFTMTGDEEQEFQLTKLPIDLSDDIQAGLTQLQNSILKLPKQIKGKFSENKVSFEPGSLTIAWPTSRTGAEAKLLEIYQAQDGMITMLIKYGILPAKCISVRAQDFANFVECNIASQEPPKKVPNEEKPKTKQPLEPGAGAAKPIVVQAVQVASTIPPSTSAVLSVPAADIKTSVLREPTEQEKMFTDIFKNMNQRFTQTWIIKRSTQSCQNFGQYLMNQIFSQATSSHYNSKTGEFTLIFDKEQAFNLTRLPRGVSDESGLAQLQGSILKLSKQIKGKFSGNKVFFEPGSLTFAWPNSWNGAEAKLLEIYQPQDGMITMVIKYGIWPAKCISVPAQDFPDFVEYNIAT